MNKSRKIVIAGLLIALGLIIPRVFHMVNLAGPVFLPMYYPVMIGALILGWRYGLFLGIIIPILSLILTGMPPLFPIGIAMVVQLGIIGIILGVLRKRNLIVTVIISQILSNFGYCIAMYVFLGFAGKPFVLTGVLTSVFLEALPGLIAQIILIPIIVKLLRRAGIRYE